MPAWLLPLLAGAGKIGSIFGGAAKESADQRASENNQAAQRNSLLAQIYNTRQNATMAANTASSREQSDHADLDLARRRFALAAPSARASQSVRGSILQNAQPVTLSGLPDRVSSRIPQISGGLSPALFTDETRQLGGELTRQALLDQLKGDEFAPLERTDFASGILPTPALEDYQKSGLLEQILGGAGLVGSVAGGVDEAITAARNRRRSATGGGSGIDPYEEDV